MTTTTKPGKNGRTHKYNGHATRLAGPPLDAVPTVGEPKSVEAEKPASAGRTTKGTFAPGNTFARGNPNARKMAALRSALLESMTAERTKALGEKLYAAALDGDWIAAKLLLAYTIGKPPEAVNADEVDLNEYELMARRPDQDELR